MEEYFSLILIVFSMHLFAIQHTVSGASKLHEYKSQSGGGNCVAESDCNEHGFCLVRDTKHTKPECICFEDFTGEFCEEKEISGLQRNDEPPAVKEGEKVTSSDGERKGKIPTGLEPDQKAEATGFSPEDLANADQPFVIYSPRMKKYVAVSEDKSQKDDSEKGNSYVETSKEILGRKKLFKLKKTSDDFFNIIFTDQDGKEIYGYMYVSDKKKKGILRKSRAVMISKSIGTAGSYEFRFNEHLRQSGIYSITCKECDGDLLFVSMDFNWRLNRFIEMDGQDREAEETIWFQFGINEKVEYARIARPTSEVRKQRSIGGIVDSKSIEDFEGLSDKIDFSIDREFTTTRTFTKTNSITIGADVKLSPALSAKAEFQSSVTRSEVEMEKVTKKMSWPIKPVKGKRTCATAEIFYETNLREVEDLLIVSRTKKEFKVGYTVEEHSQDMELKIKTVELGGKCPHEK